MRSHCSSIGYATDRGQHHGSTPDLFGLSTIQRPILVTATCYEYDFLCLKRQSSPDQIERVTAIGLEFVFSHHNTTQHNTTQQHSNTTTQQKQSPTTVCSSRESTRHWANVNKAGRLPTMQCFTVQEVLSYSSHAHSDLPLSCSKVTEIQPRRVELKLIKAVSRF